MASEMTGYLPIQSDNINFPLAEVMDVLPFPVVLLEAEDKFIWLNHAGEHFFKSSLSILAGHRWTGLLPQIARFFPLSAGHANPAVR